MYLLDTHTLIWFLFDEDKLPSRLVELIVDADDIRVSPCSLWEIAIKQSIGKLDLSYTIDEIGQTCFNQNIQLLPAQLRHFEAIKALPDIHKDPFDRLLVAQAQCEGLTIVTKDANIQRYDVETIWD